MNRYVKYALLGVVCLFVNQAKAAPVDATLLKKIADGFRCSVSDFVSVGATLKSGDGTEREEVFRAVETLNAQIAKQCKVSVLNECCKSIKAGEDELYGFGHLLNLTGPIEALGIKAGFVEGYTNANPFPRSYETIFDQETLSKGVECFVKKID
jgi:hypothetical protein